MQSVAPGQPATPLVEAAPVPQPNPERSVVIHAYSAEQVILGGSSSPIGIFLPEVPRPHAATQLYVITGSPEAPPSFSGDKEAAKHLVKILHKGSNCPGPFQNGAWSGQCFDIPKGASLAQPQRLGTFRVGPRSFQLVADPRVRGVDTLTVIVSEVSRMAN